jgi:hypothetical protein
LASSQKICFLSEKQNTVVIFSGGKGGGEGGGKKKLNPFKEIAKNNVTKKWLFYEGLTNDCHVFFVMMKRKFLR